MELPKYLTVEGVCELLSISRRTLERLRKEEKFPEPDFYLGKHPRWEINRLVAELTKRKKL